MDRYEFKEAMRRGLGRAYIALKTQDKEQFRDIVQWGCLQSLSINMQSDGSLAEYLYRLVRCYDDPESFATPLVNAFLPLPFDEDSELFHQYALLLGEFAKGGSKQAEEALLLRYEDFLEMMSRPDFAPKYLGCYEDQYLCVIASALLDVSVDRYLVKIATDLGRLAEKLDDDCPFHWLYCHFEYAMPRGVLRALADVHTHEVDVFLLNLYAHYSDRVELCDGEDGDLRLERVEIAFKKSILAGLTERLLEADPHLFEKKQTEDPDEEDESDVTEEEIFSRDPLDLEFDDDVEDETEDDDEADEVERRLSEASKKANAPFEGGFAGRKALMEERNFDALVACLQHFDKDVSRKAKFIFSELSHERAREYALQRLAVEGPDWWTLLFLIRRYRKEDKALLLTMISRMETDFEDVWRWHSIVQAIISEKCDYGVDLPAEFFRAAYELSLCRNCRYTLLQQMYERDAVPIKVQIECYYDGNEDIRDFAQEHNFTKKDY